MGGPISAPYGHPQSSIYMGPPVGAPSMYIGSQSMAPAYGSSIPFGGPSSVHYDMPYSGASAVPYDYGSHVTPSGPYGALHMQPSYPHGPVIGTGILYYPCVEVGKLLVHPVCIEHVSYLDAYSFLLIPVIF